MVERVAQRVGVLATLVLLVGGALVWAVAAPAQAACTCQDQTTQEHADGADAVFSGTVRETRRSAPDESGRVKGVVTYVVDVERVWQEDGTVVTDTVKVTSPRAESACGLGDLPPGTEYVFFAKARDTGFRAAACGGSGPLTEAVEADVVSVLGEGRAVVPELETPVLELTAVDTSAPRSVTRVAAPGAALAIVGLLGLVLVRVAGSRRG